jgi:pyruvate/2-oxoglutarate/acetoin dehydrogenase E1 component
MKRQGIAEALRDGIAEEMTRDPSVFCIGEDIGVPGGWGGAFTVTLGLAEKFPGRIIDTPIAELGFTGMAVGAAMMGLRPIADMQYGDFLFLASDQLINNAAKMRYMSGGTVKVPMVMRAPIGATGRGSQHAQSMERYFTGVPGLKVVAVSNAYDAKGILKAAVRDDNPVMILSTSCSTVPRARAPNRGRWTPPARSPTRITPCHSTAPPCAARAGMSRSSAGC